MNDSRARRIPLVLAGLSLLVVLAGQAVGDRVLAAGPSDAPVTTVARVSLSYLSGIRTFAGAVLWNRLDPLLHSYYVNVPISQQRYMLSTIAMVEWLSPDFDQPYYVGSWILIRNDRADLGLAMAKTGVERLPRSGVLRASYAQLLLLHGGDIRAAVEQAKLSLSADIRWADTVEQANSLASMAQLLRQAGETALADQLGAEIDRLDFTADNPAPPEVHDHNSDGVPDH